MRRIEEDILRVSVSSNCGTTWTSTPIDFTDLKVPTSDGVGFARDADRWETYFDPFDKKLYFSANTAKNFVEAKVPSIFSADASTVTSAADLHPTLLRQLPAATPPFVMTTALDEAATLPSGGTGRWVHFATLRCNGSALLEVATPFGLRTYDLQDSSDPSTLCETVPLGGTLAPNLWHGPSLVGTASWPPRFYAAYTGKGATNGTEIVNVVEVTLRSAQQYNAPPIIRRLNAVDFSSTSKHALFPQLIRVDNAGGSDLTLDTPIVLRYTLWDRSTNVEEHARVVYSGFADAQTQDINLATWSVATACGGGGCFPGDYRYGTFHRKNNRTLTFFTPWTGQSSTAGVGGVFGQGATIDVVPRN
jgi:hypothetical protein